MPGSRRLMRKIQGCLVPGFFVVYVYSVSHLKQLAARTKGEAVSPMFKNSQMALLFAALFAVMVGFGMVVPLLPFVARELGASSLHMGLLVTSWAAAQLVSAPRWGGFSDRHGRRPAIILGLVGFGLAFIMMGLAPSLWILYLARIMGGAISSSTMPSTQAYVADTTSRAERGAAMGLMGAAFGLGFLLGPSIGGLLAFLGARTAFFIAGGVGWITALLVYFFLPEPENRSLSTVPGLSVWQVSLQAVRKPFAVLFLMPFMITFAGSSMFSMMGFFLMDRFSSGQAHVSLAFAVLGGAGVVTQGFIIRLALKRMTETAILTVGLSLAAVGFLLLILAPTVGAVMLALAVAGAGQSLGRPMVSSLLSKATDMSQGVTMGLQASFDSLGRVVGPLWAGFAYSFAPTAPFMTAVAVCLCAVLFMKKVGLVASIGSEEEALV